MGKSRKSEEAESGASDEDMSDEAPRNKSKKRASKDEDDDSQVSSCGPVLVIHVPYALLACHNSPT
jgi:hypothetical protein